jgi:beta-galactosidase
LDHTTPRGTGRKWTEAKRLFQLARQNSEIWLAPVETEVAVLYDSDNIFAWQAQPQSNTFNFENEVHRVYYPFWRSGASVDVLSIRHILGDEKKESWLKSKYRVLVLPVPMLTNDSLLPLVEDFVKKGGSVWIGFRSDLKNEDGQIRRIPSRLAKLAGVEIVEIESLNSPKTATLQRVGSKGSATAVTWREGLQIIDGTPTKAVWQYTDNFFGGQGYAAVTQRDFNGSKGGEIVYIGTGIDEESLVPLATSSLERQGVRTAGIAANPNVEQMIRKDKSGKMWHVVINHGEESVSSDSIGQLSPFEIRISKVVFV